MTIGSILLFFALATLIAYKISDELNTEFQANDDLDSHGKAAYSQINGMYPGVIDGSFLFLTIGLCIVALILAMLVRFHPVFFVFFLIIFVIIIFLSAVFSNIYLEIANTDEFSAIAEDLTFITHIMGQLPMIIGVFGFILAAVMYKMWRADQ